MSRPESRPGPPQRPQPRLSARCRGCPSPKSGVRVGIIDSAMPKGWQTASGICHRHHLRSTLLLYVRPKRRGPQVSRSHSSHTGTPAALTVSSPDYQPGCAPGPAQHRGLRSAAWASCRQGPELRAEGAGIRHRNLSGMTRIMEEARPSDLDAVHRGGGHPHRPCRFGNEPRV